MNGIRHAESPADLERCFPLMQELRPSLDLRRFLDQVARQTQREGYRIAFLEDGGRVVSAAGYRVVEMLAWDRILYVDDLVTTELHRGEGYGSQLFDWLVAEARRLECDQFHLDSGVHRFGAHRFYLHKGMDITSHHFALKLRTDQRLKRAGRSTPFAKATAAIGRYHPTMKVSVDVPRNATVLKHLASYPRLPGKDWTGAPRTSPDAYYELGCHPDLVEHLWDQLTLLLPTQCRWIVIGTPALVHPRTGVIFGLGLGTHTCGLRLPANVRTESMAQGAKTIHHYNDGAILEAASLGEHWVLIGWHKDDAFWCLSAYEFAGVPD